MNLLLLLACDLPDRALQSACRTAKMTPSFCADQDVFHEKYHRTQQGRKEDTSLEIVETDWCIFDNVADQP